MDEDAREVEHRLKQEIRNLREELTKNYITKYEIMAEYLSRKENEQMIDKASQRKREWPVIVAGAVVSLVTLLEFGITVAEKFASH